MSYKIVDLGKIEGADFSERNLIIQNGERVILVDWDACHTVYDSLDAVVTNGGKTVRDILGSEAVAEVDSVSQYIHYWGIKDRIESNYRLLLKSVRKIGIDVNSFPAWGK